MIVFKTEQEIEIDLSNYGVSLNEESDLFTDSIHKNYSPPFTIDGVQDLLIKLGLPHLDNVVNVETKIKGQLILPHIYYNANLFLGEIRGSYIECHLSYGATDLPVYDFKLKDLPWPFILSPERVAFPNKTKEKSWPETGFNFPMLHKVKIAEENNYEKFLGFVNNHNGVSYIENNIDNSGTEPVYNNLNVFAPFPYLLEILRFGYAQEGKSISGELIEHPVLKKALYVPEKYLERFRGSEYQAFSFTFPDRIVNGRGFYTRQFIPAEVGTYHLKLEFNLDPVLASSFVLTVKQFQPNPLIDTATHFRAESNNNRVKISQEIKINITPETVFDIIEVELIIPYTAESVAAVNKIEFSRQDGKLNEFPTYFTLAEFMPDMTFGQFENELKNWLNLDKTVNGDKVEFNFTQNSILRKHQESHKHLEIPDPPKEHNSNRFYKLRYANGEEVFYNRNGQVFSNLDSEGDEVIEIDMDVQPAVVEQREDIFTAVAPEEPAGITFCLYEGPDTSGRPTCIQANQLSLQNVFIEDWQEWLRYRVHSKTFKENFECSVHERINIDEISFKYNELHIIKKLNKKYLSEEVMKVDVESETF